MNVILADGSTHQVRGTWKQLVDRLTSESLTGSAAPLAVAMVETMDGKRILFGEIVGWEDGCKP